MAAAVLTVAALSVPASVQAAVGTAQTNVTVAVQDASTGQPWSGDEQPGAAAIAKATVLDAGAGTPSGTVTYSLYDDSVCATPPVSTDPIALDGGGNVPASDSTGNLAAGQYGFEAGYSGDDDYAAATSSCIPFTVAGAPPQSVTLTASASPTSATYGNTIILGATGLSAGATGTVTFTAAGSALCTAPVSLGSASCTTSELAVGDYTVTAAYGGDPSDLPTSATTGFTITAAATAAFHFVAPPSIAVGRPVNGARYTRDEAVRASYSCRDGSDAPGLASCKGSVASGALIDTRRTGTFAFTVRGMSRSGESTVRTLHYVVVVPDNRIAVDQPDLRTDGTGTVRLRVPGPGGVTALETAWPADRGQPQVDDQDGLSRGQATAGRAGPITVALTPSPSGRQLLRRSQGTHLRVRLLVTYTPTGGDARQATKYGLLAIG